MIEKTNTNEKEKALNEELMDIIKKMPGLYKNSGNSFRRHKLALFITLSQMNEFKGFINKEFDMSRMFKISEFKNTQ